MTSCSHISKPLHCKHGYSSGSIQVDLETFHCYPRFSYNRVSLNFEKTKCVFFSKVGMFRKNLNSKFRFRVILGLVKCFLPLNFIKSWTLETLEEINV